jgi:arylsulfatase A-like enzyme
LSSRWIVSCGLLVLSVATSIACGPSTETTRPNVILISADTLRADHVGANGYPRATTPTIDALAASGVNFTRAYSHAPNTAPSHTSILTSLYPSVHGVLQHGQIPNEKLVALPEALREAGYQTGAFTQLNGDTFRPGFDTWHFMESGVARGKGLGELTMVADWIGERTAPWFLFLHSYDVHLPYAPEPEYVDMWAADYEGPMSPRIDRGLVDRINGESPDGRVFEATERDLQYILDMYDAELRRLDDIYARFFARLREMGAWDDTIVVFLSDHGEEFGEHGKWGRHTYSIHEELLRVPLVITGPGVPVGRSIDAAVRLVDVAPTIMELVGVDQPQYFMGESLVPIWTGDERTPRQVVVERGVVDIRQALIHDGFKYMDDGRLFDLRADKWGTVDVSADHPEIVEAMTESLLDWAGQFSALATLVRSDGQVQLSEEEKRRLRALGYLR